MSHFTCGFLTFSAGIEMEPWCEMVYAWRLYLTMIWSSRPEVFCKKGALKNFAKFTGKHLCQSLFLNKVVGLRPVTLLKKRLWHRSFPVSFPKFLRTPIFIEHLWWLLLNYFKQPWKLLFRKTQTFTGILQNIRARCKIPLLTLTKFERIN